MSKTERALETDEVDSTLDLDRFVTSEVEEADRAIDDLIDGANGNGNGSENGNGHGDSTGDVSVPTGFVTSEIDVLDTGTNGSDDSVPTGFVTSEIEMPDLDGNGSADDSAPTGIVIDDPMLPPILMDDEQPVELHMSGGVPVPTGYVDQDVSDEIPVPGAYVEPDVSAEIPSLREFVEPDPSREVPVAAVFVEPDVSAEMPAAATDALLDELEFEAVDADTDVVDVVEVDDAEPDVDESEAELAEVDAELIEVDDAEPDVDEVEAELVEVEEAEADVDGVEVEAELVEVDEAEADVDEVDAELVEVDDAEPDVDEVEGELVEVDDAEPDPDEVAGAEIAETDDAAAAELVEPDVDADVDVESDPDVDLVDVVEVGPGVELEPDVDTEVVDLVEVDPDIVAVPPDIVPATGDDPESVPFVMPVIVPATGDAPVEADVEEEIQAREGDLDEEVSDDILEELRRADIDGPVVDFAPQDDTTSARRAPKRRPDYDPAPMPIPARPPRVLGRKPRVRKVTRVVQHVDPWTVFKIALVAFMVLYIVLLVAGVLLWNVAYATGTIDNVERFFESFGWSSFEFNGGEIYHAAWIAGLFGVIGLTGMAVLTATLFNLITDIVGGMRFTVLEEEVVETRTSPMRRFVVRRPEPEVPATIPDPTGDPSGTIIREAIVDDSGAIEKRA